MTFNYNCIVKTHNMKMILWGFFIYIIFCSVFLWTHCNLCLRWSNKCQSGIQNILEWSFFLGMVLWVKYYKMVLTALCHYVPSHTKTNIKDKSAKYFEITIKDSGLIDNVIKIRILKHFKCFHFGLRLDDMTNFEHLVKSA